MKTQDLINCLQQTAITLQKTNIQTFQASFATWTLVAMPCRKGYNTYTLGEVNEVKTDD